MAKQTREQRLEERQRVIREASQRVKTGPAWIRRVADYQDAPPSPSMSFREQRNKLMNHSYRDVPAFLEMNFGKLAIPIYNPNLPPTTRINTTYFNSTGLWEVRVDFILDRKPYSFINYIRDSVIDGLASGNLQAWQFFKRYLQVDFFKPIFDYLKINRFLDTSYVNYFHFVVGGTPYNFNRTKELPG